MLVVGVDDRGYEKLRAGLARYPLEVERIPRAASALELAAEIAFHLLILSHPLAEPPTEEFLAAVRRPDGASRAAIIVLLAAPAERRGAERLLAQGVRAVLGSELEAPLLHRAVLEALGVPPRVDLRLLVRLEARLEDGQSAVFCQTENLSRSGMLVRSERRYPLGTAVAFELALSGGDRGVRGQAEVVRHTDLEREALRGLGLRFSSFDGDGRRRLAVFLERLA